MNTPKKNTRRAAMDAERLDWKCFRFADDKRQWKPLARERRAYFVKAANAADQDGTHVEISAKTFRKAGGEQRTAFNRFGELAEMGVMLPTLHVDRDGTVREKLSPLGTKVRRLRYEPLIAAQKIIDAEKEFKGHKKLTSVQQFKIQNAWLAETNPEGVQKPPKGMQNSRNQRSAEVTQGSAKVTPKECKSHPKECNRTLHTTEGVEPKFRPTDPTNRNGNSGQAGGMAGTLDSNPAVTSPADKVESLLTEDTMLEALQKTHKKMWDSINGQKGREGHYEMVPITPNLSGCGKLFDAVRKRGVTHTEHLELLCTAYRVWFDCKYIPSFDDVMKAEEKAFDDAKVRIPEPIKCPLVMFRKELGVWLDEAREQMD